MTANVGTKSSPSDDLIDRNSDRILIVWLGRLLSDRQCSPPRGVSSRESIQTIPTRVSLPAVGLILTIATAWSAVANAGFLGWDPHYYYDAIDKNSWLQVYPLEPTLFLIIGALHPWSLASYIFIVITISLGILLLAFTRLGYSRLDQTLLILFFSCSFYGLHFMVAFHRQFFGIIFFILAVAGGRGSFVARVASLLSQLFTFSLHIFWESRRLSAKAASIVALLIVPVVFLLSKTVLADKSDQYSAYGLDDPLHLAIKQTLTVLFAIIIILTVKRENNPLRSMASAYIALGLPAIVWPYYAGLFSRVDYFLLPVLVALWRFHVRDDRIVLSRFCIVGFTTVGFYLWMRSNLACEVMGYCQ